MTCTNMRKRCVLPLAHASSAGAKWFYVVVQMREDVQEQIRQYMATQKLAEGTIAHSLRHTLPMPGPKRRLSTPTQDSESNAV